MAYFGTNDMREVVKRAKEGREEYVVFMKRFIEILTVALVGACLVACESMKLGDAGLSKARRLPAPPSIHCLPP